PADAAPPAPPRAREPPGARSAVGAWRRGWAGGGWGGGWGSIYPIALLLLPDGGSSLDLVDDLAGAEERGVAVRRRDGHRDGGLGQGDDPDAVLGRSRAQPVAPARRLDD